MTYPSNMIDLIDARILRFMQQPIAMGTVESRDPTGSKALVVFDGDNTSVPVKVLANVPVFAPDRVLMVRVIGSGQRVADLLDTRKPSPGEWVIVGGFTRRTGSGSYTSATGVFTAHGLSSTSTAFSNQPDIPALTFVKRYDDTRVVLRSDIGNFVNSGVPVVAEHALRVNGVDNVTGRQTYSSVSHLPVVGSATVTGLPAGEYPVQARWRRVSGTGAVESNAGDSYFISAEEIAP